VYVVTQLALLTTVFFMRWLIDILIFRMSLMMVYAYNRSIRSEPSEALQVVPERLFPSLFLQKFLYIDLVRFNLVEERPNSVNQSELILDDLLLLIVVNSGKVLMVAHLGISQVLLDVLVLLGIGVIHLLNLLQVLQLVVDISDEKDLLKTMVGELPFHHSHQQDWLNGERIGFQFHLVVDGQSFLLDLIEKVGVRLNLPPKRAFQPDMLEEVVFHAEAVSDQQCSVGKSSVTEVNLCVLLEVSEFSGFHDKVCVVLSSLLLGLVVVGPRSVLYVIALNSLLAFHQFLIFCSLSPVELHQVLPVSVDMQLGLLDLLEGLLKLLSACFVLILKNLELFNDHAEVDECKSPPF
jgi:hypothetical protein